MRRLLLFALLVCWSANAQNDIEDLLSVGEFQEASREFTTAERELFQGSVHAIFNGYRVGFAQGLSVAAFKFGAADEDLTVTFTSCMPAADRLVDMLLAAPPSDANLTVLDFATKAVLDLCGDTIDRVLQTKQ